MQKSEFDDYIDFYRTAQQHAISISGESEDYFVRLRADRLLAWLPEFADQSVTILDFGASDGQTASIVKERFPKARVIGSDPSSRSIAYAKKAHPELEFFIQDGNHLPFDTASIDLAYAVGVFHHIPRTEHEAAYREIFRVLKPGGAFVLFEMNPWNPVTQFVFARSAVDRNAKMFSSRFAVKLLRQYGVARVRYYAYFPRFLKFLRPLEPHLEKIPASALYAVIVQP